MIPTLYDYWVNDIRIILEKEKYRLYPTNPYETVINTRPPISFYNDNNPDWLNVMIFYHVLGHIDFFHNNIFFKNTWTDDFLGRARADKRLIARLRSEHGRWVDYVIEFARGIDNISGYYRELSSATKTGTSFYSKRMDYYFDVFLQKVRKVPHHEYLQNLKRYNDFARDAPAIGESLFFSEVKTTYPEFDSYYGRYSQNEETQPTDIIEYLLFNSPFLNREENKWMKSVLTIVRETSLYFEPQRRDQIFNEGWASYWHERLYLKDSRIRGHEVDFALVHAKVTSLPKIGINPSAIGMRLIDYIGDLADKGRISYDFERTRDIEKRRHYNRGAPGDAGGGTGSGARGGASGGGTDYLFKLREEHCDFTLVNTFLDQDFVNRYKLFTVEKVLNADRKTWQYIVKSRKAADYKQMIIDSLWHPPYITVDASRTDENWLYLDHRDEGKPLIAEYIPNTMLGVEFLWGGGVKLETTDMHYEKQAEGGSPSLVKKRILYSMRDKRLEKREL
jgi:stage V sporulation protein R